jgi:hypothetical protein
MRIQLAKAPADMLIMRQIEIRGIFSTRHPFFLRPENPAWSYGPQRIRLSFPILM